MFSSVVLFGGTGDVGKRVVELLLTHTDFDVVLVSRRGGTDTKRVKKLALDLSDAKAREKIPTNAVTVNLTEATPPSLLGTIVGDGGTFLDISASPQYVAAIEDEVAAVDSLGSGVICVGTAPGLSTLVAARTAQAEGAASVDVGIELGMGRHYGPAATEWFFESVGSSYSIGRGSHIQAITSGSLSRSFRFEAKDKRRPAVGIGFPDQGIAPAGKSATVRTFLAVDPSYVTRVLSVLLKLGFGRLFAKWSKPLAKILTKTPALGGANSRITAESYSVSGELLGKGTLKAGDQSDLTAGMIVATLLAIHSAQQPKYGLRTVGDFLTVEIALDSLRKLLPTMKIEAEFSGEGLEQAKSDCCSQRDQPQQQLAG
ncbi:hypothetical protein E1162_07585 [Rhodobacteraceae bacterium RKSG542]|uniref:hypothetical protein n=1 Tax=Pseudovibrio flavus TaxID=2529854 RepID=UPI0012BBCD00|nr:hypothetical protein [Pseudovibrio flavus]MTI17100.1 hypothetical protein [Pseudovibrio flavus]